MGKYKGLAEEIIKNVGGKENIASLTHCVTRLRFQLKDEAEANDEAVKNMEGIVTLMKSAGQYQIVIGNHVSDVYAEVVEIAGLKDSSSDDETKKKQSVGQMITDYMSAILHPVLPVLSGAGIIKGLLAILTFTKVLAETDGIYMLLHAAGDATLFFFPILLGFSSAKKFGMTSYLGAAIGGALVYPTIQGLEKFTVFGLDLSNVSYTTTVIPIILIIAFAAPLERWLKKWVPDAVKMFIIPATVLLISVPVGYCLIGPAANWLSNLIGAGLMAVYGISPLLCIALVAGVWQVLVMLGLHFGVVMVILVDFLSVGSSLIMTGMHIPSFAQTGAVLAIWLKTKDKKLKEVALPAWISGVFGITEPAIYGVTLPRIKTFIITCIASAIAGAFAGLTKITFYQLAGTGIFTIAGYISPDGKTTNMINYMIAISLAFVISTVLTFILFKDEEKAETQEDDLTNYDLDTPLVGDVLPLSEVEDNAFSKGILGEGVAVYPIEGKVFAPASGTVTTLFPTHHAIGITTDSGVELLIHIGMDTVNLQGKYFYPKVAQGDQVEKGQLLMEFDLEKIKEEGYSLLTPIVITNTENFSEISLVDKDTISKGQLLVSIN